MTEKEQVQPRTTIPPRSITKTEFRELSFESQMSILRYEALRLDENCLPYALQTLAEAYDRLKPPRRHFVIEDII